jgi:hypothetical protein
MGRHPWATRSTPASNTYRADENDDFRHFSPKIATFSRAGRS